MDDAIPVLRLAAARDAEGGFAPAFLDELRTFLKGWFRSHPEVAARHHPELAAARAAR